MKFKENVYEIYWPLKVKEFFHHCQQELKVAFLRKYDAFFKLPKKCAENYPEKNEIAFCSI